jgi:hypothetical protein
VRFLLPTICPFRIICMVSTPLRMIRVSEFFEAENRSSFSLDGSMILLDNIIEELALSDRYVRTVLSVKILDAGLVRSALIDICDARKRLFLTARAKKRRAARRSRLAVNRKSTVFPCLSTARYQYRSSPRILMYVSSMRQLLPIAPMQRVCAFVYETLPLIPA